MNMGKLSRPHPKEFPQIMFLVQDGPQLVINGVTNSYKWSINDLIHGKLGLFHPQTRVISPPYMEFFHSFITGYGAHFVGEFNSQLEITPKNPDPSKAAILGTRTPTPAI